jgi:translocation and assembly module TamB
VADSLPLELIPQLTASVSNVHGEAAARVAVRGTLERPALVGSFLLTHGTAKVTVSGSTISNVFASVRMLNDTVYVDSIVGRAKGPIRVRGEVAVGTWRDPSFKLYLVAQNVEVLNGDKGQLFADVGLALTGPLTRPDLSGQVAVRSGVIRVPDPTGKKVIGAGDPGVYDVVDTTDATDRQLFPSSSALMRNLRMNVGVVVQHNTWIRTHDANIEMYTDYPINVRVYRERLAVTGAILTDRGEYTFSSKRFQISRGSAQFIGGTDLNPTLAVTGDYQVQPPSQPIINIHVIIGGTARHPKLALESDAQPPKSQSELLSLLAFGSSTTSLLQPTGSSLSSAGATGDIVGAGAALAVRRLAGVAMGVAVDQLQTQAGRAIGADFFNITPADVPELGGTGGILNFMQQTSIEAGRYVNQLTFVGVQKGADNLPGARIEHRTTDGWRFAAQIQPTLILKEPSLRQQNVSPTTSWGGFVIREWRF